jgi:hypothetical protein
MFLAIQKYLSGFIQQRQHMQPNAAPVPAPEGGGETIVQ